MNLSTDERQAVRKAITTEKIKAIAMVMAALAMVIMAVALLMSAVANNNTANVAKAIEKSSECRFDRNADISRVNDLLDYWTWVGLKAIAEEDQATLAEAIRNGDPIAEEFRQVIDSRQGIVERCDEGNNE